MDEKDRKIILHSKNKNGRNETRTNISNRRLGVSEFKHLDINGQWSMTASQSMFISLYTMSA